MAWHGGRSAAGLGAHGEARRSCSDPVGTCRDFRRRAGVGAGQRSAARVGLKARFDEVSAMTSDRTILITGVTGHQGGAVARALQGTGFHLRGLTRTPDSEPAAALAQRGIELVKGDLDDESTLRRALAGAWGVFGVQNAGEVGAEREEVQGNGF